MLRSAKHLGTLLPKGWPRQVRSAVVHAISMSNVVFTVTRSHAENHFNARVRIRTCAGPSARKQRLFRLPAQNEGCGTCRPPCEFTDQTSGAPLHRTR